MRDTVIVTWIPHVNKGKIDLGPPVGKGDYTWTVHVESANTPFLQKIDSPERKTASRTLPEIHDTTTDSYAYLEFANSGDAHDAYAYFSVPQAARPVAAEKGSQAQPKMQSMGTLFLAPFSEWAFVETLTGSDCDARCAIRPYQCIADTFVRLFSLCAAGANVRSRSEEEASVSRNSDRHMSATGY